MLARRFPHPQRCGKSTAIATIAEGNGVAAFQSPRGGFANHPLKILIASSSDRSLSRWRERVDGAIDAMAAKHQS